MSSRNSNNGNNPSSPQQQSPSGSSRSSRNSSGHSTLVRPVMDFLLLLLRAILWPVRRLSNVLFPAHEFDGLEDAITAKASRHFVTQYLKGNATEHSSNVENAATSSLISNVWVTNAGFAQIKQDAVQTQSMMLVYLHSPLHRNAQQFISNVLNDARWLDFLHTAQQAAGLMPALGVSIHSAQGAYLANMLQATAYPLLALLYPKSNTQLSLVFSAQGPVLLDMSLNRLLQQVQLAVQRHQTVLVEQQTRRVQREQEQELRRQQDAEYQQALAQDQERERQAEVEREEQRQEEQAKELELAMAKSLIQPEPTANGADVTNVRFVLPSGTKLNRKFGSSERFAALRAFVRLHFVEQLQDDTVQRIGLSSHFPRKTYNDKEYDDMTLDELGLGGQAVVLMVQDLDA